MNSVLKNKIEKALGDKFVYSGIHLSTKGLKPDGKSRKKPICPIDYDKIESSSFETFELENKRTKEKYKVNPNGVILLQKNSKFSCIDVDKPDECSILDRLNQDCNQVHKTKNGYHFLFNGNDLPRSTCGVVDINTNIFYVPEYKNEFHEVIGKYEIIKMRV